ncbi:MAG: hypothetical protein COV47_02570 [Candidatus Diapherotrites archaeon CG11_big_fil_rev_8_21_14_0_20_37_9]|nr:MAG: hypothetical protein COV47_02570 [Candidatus Diapherotrites archaeon CG11_big_fil_rev_8_21_14_0_20_37_9]
MSDKLLSLGQKGQAFDAYHLLIGAILGFSVLLIIVSSINYFEGLRMQVSQERFFTGLNNAVDQPNGEILLIDDLIFQADTSYTSRALERATGLEEGCLVFDDSGSTAFDVSPELVTAKENIIGNISAICSTNSDGFCTSSCQVCCEITFNAQ